ncbi:hypothetical protein HMI55_004048, partial [Coelomomyces lativittatus]
MNFKTYNIAFILCLLILMNFFGHANASFFDNFFSKIGITGFIEKIKSVGTSGMNYVFPKNYEKSVPLPTHADKVKYSNQNPISLFEKVTRILEESLQYSSNPLQPVAFSCDDILQELQSSLNEGASRFATAFPISTEEIDENEEFIDSEDDEDDD